MKPIIPLLAILLILSGCQTERRKNFVVLIDNSISVPPAILKRYIKVIQESILSNFGDKDRLVIQFVDECSQTQAERIYVLDLANMSFKNKYDGVNTEADSIRARRGRYLLAEQEKMGNAILQKREERKGCGSFTDIINALNEVEKLVDRKKNFDDKKDKLWNDIDGDGSYAYETCIVLFSDMVNEDKEHLYDFTGFGKIKKSDVDNKIKELETHGKIPNLHGVKVVAYGATSTGRTSDYSARQIENIKQFWNSFFSQANADLKAYGYDTELELANYVNTK